jgi:hypothetical protein
VPDLHDWITQQVDETEATARACTATDWRHVFDGIIVDRDTDGWQSAPDQARIASVAYERIYWSTTPPHSPDADHIVTHDPDSVLRRCAADRKILARHRLDPDAIWHEAAMCKGCGDYGDQEFAYTENLNDCPELLDLAYAHGLTDEILATLDRPQEGERPEPRAFRIGPPARSTSSVPPGLRGPNWKP